MSTANPFSGTFALVRAERHGIARAALWGGIVPGLVVGVLVLAFGVRSEVGAIMAIVIATLVVCVPLVLGAIEPFGRPAAGARSRREELLALPLGRQAMPLASMVLSLTASAAALACLLGALTLILGLRNVEAALAATDPGTHGRLAPMGVAYAIGVPVLALCASIAAIGRHAAGYVAFVALAAFLALISIDSLGYAASEVQAFRVLAGATVSLAFLALPFVLHAGPTHRWADDGESMSAPDIAALAGGCVGLLVFTLGGVGLPLAIVLGATATAILLARRLRPRVARRPTPALRVALLAAFAAIVPLAIAGHILDARGVESALRPRPAEGRSLDYLPSPDGRFVLVRAGNGSIQSLVGRGEDAWDHDVGGALLVPVDGDAPPRRLVPRFASVALDAWSRDGRYVAVTDLGAGRVNLLLSDVVTIRNARPQLISILLSRMIETVVVDVRTGEETRIPRALLAPGWTRPEELVRLRRRVDGDLDLEDGRGRRATLEPDRPIPRVLRYEAAGPLIEIGDRALRLTEAGLVPVGPTPTWHTSCRALPLDRDARGRAQPITHTAFIFEVRRREEKHALHGDFHPVQLDDRTCIASGSSGLVRLDLETGESTMLAEGAPLTRRVHGVTVDPAGGSGARAVLSWKEGGLGVLDIATGAIAPLGATDRRLWCHTIHGDRVFGLDDTGTMRWFEAAGGPSRAVYPR